MEFEVIEKPYLIQRAKFEKHASKDAKGIDSLLRFDYMGAAEFEFGALPKSLKRVREEIEQYTSFQYSFKNNPTKLVTVFCKKEQIEEVTKVLELLVAGKIHLKGHCDLNYFVKPIEGRDPSWYNDFWWDIINDFFFWKFNPDFDQRIKEAIKTKPQ